MYFYKLMKMRTAKNSIRCLCDDHDDRIEVADRIEVLLCKFIKALLKEIKVEILQRG